MAASRSLDVCAEELAAMQAQAALSGEYAKAQEYLFWLDDLGQRGIRVVRCLWCGVLHRSWVDVFCGTICEDHYAAAVEHRKIARHEPEANSLFAWVSRGRRQPAERARQGVAA